MGSRQDPQDDKASGVVKGTSAFAPPPTPALDPLSRSSNGTSPPVAPPVSKDSDTTFATREVTYVGPLPAPPLPPPEVLPLPPLPSRTGTVPDLRPHLEALSMPSLSTQPTIERVGPLEAFPVPPLPSPRPIERLPVPPLRETSPSDPPGATSHIVDADSWPTRPRLDEDIRAVMASVKAPLPSTLSSRTDDDWPLFSEGESWPTRPQVDEDPLPVRSAPWEAASAQTVRTTEPAGSVQSGTTVMPDDGPEEETVRSGKTLPPEETVRARPPEPKTELDPWNGRTGKTVVPESSFEEETVRSGKPTVTTPSLETMVPASSLSESVRSEKTVPEETVRYGRTAVPEASAPDPTPQRGFQPRRRTNPSIVAPTAVLGFPPTRRLVDPTPVPTAGDSMGAVEEPEEETSTLEMPEGRPPSGESRAASSKPDVEVQGPMVVSDSGIIFVEPTSEADETRTPKESAAAADPATVRTIYPTSASTVPDPARPPTVKVTASSVMPVRSGQTEIQGAPVIPLPGITDLDDDEDMLVAARARRWRVAVMVPGLVAVVAVSAWLGWNSRDTDVPDPILASSLAPSGASTPRANDASAAVAPEVEGERPLPETEASRVVPQAVAERVPEPAARGSALGQSQDDETEDSEAELDREPEVSSPVSRSTSRGSTTKSARSTRSSTSRRRSPTSSPTPTVEDTAEPEEPVTDRFEPAETEPKAEEPAPRVEVAKPQEAAEASPSDLLANANDALKRGQGSDAFRLAEQSHRRKPNEQALLLMARSGCVGAPKDGAKSALRELRISDRSRVRRECRRRGKPLGI